MAKTKHLCTMPAFGATGARTGTKYIYTLNELRMYENDLASQGLSGRPRWTAAGHEELESLKVQRAPIQEQSL